MGHDPAPKIQEIQKKNLASFDKWISAYGRMIVPGAGQAVIYAGFPEAELQKAKTILSALQQMRRMWQIIEVADKQYRDYTGCVRYDKLNDVLKRIKSPLPPLFETINLSNGNPRKFADMLDCAEKLTNPSLAMIDKGRFNYVWDKLSEQYVKNSKGEVEIWQGCKANHKLVDQSTTLIRVELKTLLDRNDLPKATAEAASKIVVSFVNHHLNQKIISEKLMNQALTTLREGSKH